jgi:hypothetical protein
MRTPVNTKHDKFVASRSSRRIKAFLCGQRYQGLFNKVAEECYTYEEDYRYRKSIIKLFHSKKGRGLNI